MNKVTLITGATSGIGFELSKIFAQNGNNLLIIGRNNKSLIEKKHYIESNFGIKVYILYQDLKEEDSIYKIKEFVKNNDLTVFNLINNAGIGSFGTFCDINNDSDLIKVNIEALTNLIKLFLPDMLKRKEGGILNISSTAGFQGGPFMACYYASKAYVLSLSEALSEEVSKSGVTISVLCPGPVNTSFQKKANIKKSGLAKNYMMEAKVVAEIGYKGFKKGKRIIIPGVGNKILIQSLRLVPRRLIQKVIRKVNEK